MTDLNTTEANEAPTSDATMLNPADFTPKTEPTRKFSGDAHGIAEAASELRKSRERPAIKRWKLDGEKTFRDAREAAPWLSANRKIARADERAARMGTDALIAGFAVGLENKLKQEARERRAPGCCDPDVSGQEAGRDDHRPLGRQACSTGE